MTEIASFEAKTHFSDLLRRVTNQSEKFIVTVRGKPVAMIGPVDKAAPTKESVGELLKQLSAFRSSLPRVTNPGETLKEMAREGLR